MSVHRFFTTAAVVLCCAAPAAAQGVKLEFHDGRVNLSAQNAPLRTILNEWAKLGGTKIVNGDRLAGGLVTLELNGVSERQALDVLLRSASGYLAGPRQPGSAGQSAYASILILPTSTAPRAVAAAPPPTFNANAGRPLPSPIPQVAQPDPDEEAASEIQDTPDDDPPVRPGIGRPRNPRDFVPPRGVAGQPFEPDLENDQIPERPQQQPVTTPTANNPFGVPAGSSRPGVITPVPQQQPQLPRPGPDPEP